MTLRREVSTGHLVQTRLMVAALAISGAVIGLVALALGGGR